jgi:hypothetical protein
MRKLLFITVVSGLFFKGSIVGVLGQGTVPAQESISAHLNATTFLTGEMLLFKIYCYKGDKTGELSDLSKVAYLELIDESQRPVAQMKLELNHGMGRGDFFFDAALPSGNYTLVAYTRWMKNFGYQNFYKQELILINPVLLPPIANFSTVVEQERNISSDVSDKAITVRLDKDEYGLREKIALKIESQQAIKINLSVNVRVDDNETVRADTRNATPRETTSNESGSAIRFLPDLRGELITGTLVEKSTGKPVPKELISLSAPSTAPVYLISRTDSAGRFYFSAPRLESRYIFFKTHNHEVNDLVVSLDSDFLGEYKAFAPGKLQIDSAGLSVLSSRYLSSQVQNVFGRTNRDSLMQLEPMSRFVTSPDKVYRLETFTRFPSMEDVFREIIVEVVTKSRGGKFSLSLTNLVTGERFSNVPLLLIDGIPVTVEVLMRYDPLLVKNIIIVAQRYYFGGVETEGVISVETTKGVAEGLNTDNLTRVDNMRHLLQKRYTTPNYSNSEALSRVPDFRTQLYWNPDVTVTTPIELIFSSNDIPGKYFVEIFGVSESGQQIAVRKKFTIVNKIP